MEESDVRSILVHIHFVTRAGFCVGTSREHHHGRNPRALCHTGGSASVRHVSAKLCPAVTVESTQTAAAVVTGNAHTCIICACMHSVKPSSMGRVNIALTVVNRAQHMNAFPVCKMGDKGQSSLPPVAGPRTSRASYNRSSLHRSIIAPVKPGTSHNALYQTLLAPVEPSTSRRALHQSSLHQSNLELVPVAEPRTSGGALDQGWNPPDVAYGLWREVILSLKSTRQMLIRTETQAHAR